MRTIELKMSSKELSIIADLVKELQSRQDVRQVMSIDFNRVGDTYWETIQRMKNRLCVEDTKSAEGRNG